MTLRDVVENALAKAGIATTGWVLVAACLEADGEEILYLEQSDGMTSWTRIGMLDEALDVDAWDAAEEPHGLDDA